LKHPNEQRFIQAMEAVSGEDLDWFFRPWLHNTRLLDYGIERWKKSRQPDGSWKVTLQIRRYGKRELPQQVEVTLEDGTTYRTWWQNHQWRQEDEFVFTVPIEPVKAVLDPEARTLDLDYRNNGTGRMPTEFFFYRPGMNYAPRNRYILQWFPSVQYHQRDGFLPGVWLTRDYGPWEHLKGGVNVGSGKVFWFAEGWRRNPLGDSATTIAYQVASLGALETAGFQISRTLDQSFHFLNLDRLTWSVFYVNVVDTNRTDLFEGGRTTVFSSRLNTHTGPLRSEMQVDLAPGGWSDWSFARITLIDRAEFRHGKFGLRGRGMAGVIWAGSDGVPVQERYTVEGAGSGGTYRKSYLRDRSSFYGQTRLRDQYHLPGDVNLRGFAGKGYPGVKQAASVSLEGFFNHRLAGLRTELALFGDAGVLNDSAPFGKDRTFANDVLMDFGFGLRLKTSVFGQELYLRLDLPWYLVEAGRGTTDFSNLIFSFQQGL